MGETPPSPYLKEPRFPRGRKREEPQWEQFERRQNEKVEDKTVKQEKGRLEYQQGVQKDFAKFGLTGKQIEHIYDSTYRRLGSGGSELQAYVPNAQYRHRKHKDVAGDRPKFPRIYRGDLAIETLQHYDLHWEYDRYHSDHIIIMQDMGVRETNKLFEHTRRLKEAPNRRSVRTIPRRGHRLYPSPNMPTFAQSQGNDRAGRKAPVDSNLIEYSNQPAGYWDTGARRSRIIYETQKRVSGPGPASPATVRAFDRIDRTTAQRGSATDGMKGANRAVEAQKDIRLPKLGDQNVAESGFDDPNVVLSPDKHDPPLTATAPLVEKGKRMARKNAKRLQLTSGTDTPEAVPSPEATALDADSPQSHSPVHDLTGFMKSYRVDMDEPCHRVLPLALKKYNIEDSSLYSLYIVAGGEERCLRSDDRPLPIFKQLVNEGKKPMFMLRKHKSASEAPGSMDAPQEHASPDEAQPYPPHTMEIPDLETSRSSYLPLQPETADELEHDANIARLDEERLEEITEVRAETKRMFAELKKPFLGPGAKAERPLDITKTYGAARPKPAALKLETTEPVEPPTGATSSPLYGRENPADKGVDLGALADELIARLSSRWGHGGVPETASQVRAGHTFELPGDVL